MLYKPAKYAKNYLKIIFVSYVKTVVAQWPFAMKATGISGALTPELFSLL